MADFLRENRTLVLYILTGVVAFVLMIVFARWFSRTRGWRRTISRQCRLLAWGVRDLARGVGAWYRFHRDVRDVARLLADPALGPDVLAAFAGAARADGAPAGPAPTDPAAAAPADPASAAPADPVPADPAAVVGTVPVRGSRPFQATVGGGSVRITIAGRGADRAGPVFARPVPPETAAADPPDLTRPGEIGDLVACCPVAVGLLGGARGALVLLDLAALPAVGTIEGPAALSRRFAAAMAAQLAAGLVGDLARPIVVDGIVAGYSGPSLPAALDRLEAEAAAGRPAPLRAGHRPPAGEGGPAGHADRLAPDQRPAPPPGNAADPAAAALTVLVCPEPSPGDLARLTRLVDLLPGLRVLVVGRYPGTRWRMELDRLGRVAAAELGLHVNAAPLERGLASALRRRARRRPRTASGSPPPPVNRPPVDGPPVSRADRSPADRSPVDGPPVDRSPADRSPADGPPVDGPPTRRTRETIEPATPREGLIEPAAAHTGPPVPAAPALDAAPDAGSGRTDGHGWRIAGPASVDAGELVEPEPARHDDEQAAPAGVGGRGVEPGAGTAGTEE